MSRRGQVDRIANLLRDQCNVALHAAPSVGKTWLADQVIAQLGGESSRVIREDLSLYDDAESVFLSILATVSSDSLDAEPGVHGAWRETRKALAERVEPSVVILDEFDQVPKFPDALEFLRLLRELVHRPVFTRCSILVLSRRSLETIEAQVRGISTLATICYPEYMAGSSVTDLMEVWGWASECEEAELVECVRWSAGYSPLVRYWLALHPTRPSGAQAEHQQVLEFGRLLDHLDLINLLEPAAQMIVGPVMDDWLRERQQLLSLGVLGTDPEDTSGGYEAHEVFKACLRRRTVNLDPWGPLGLSELRLRGIIDEVLSSRISPGWADELGKSNPAVAAALELAREKQVVDVRRFGRSMDWLAYTYPQDLTNIIMSNWPHFKAVFRSGSREQWRERLETLAKYRTPVAHNRTEVMTDAQRLQCRAYAEEILRAIHEFGETGAHSTETGPAPAV